MQPSAGTAPRTAPCYPRAIARKRQAKRRPRCAQQRAKRGTGSAETYRLTMPSVTGRMTVELSVPRAPLRLAELVSFVQRLTDLGVEHAIDSERAEGRAISCGPGCGWCCQQLVPISAPEAFRLADSLIALAPALRDAALARIDRLEQAIADAGIEPRLRALVEPQGDAEDLAALAGDYFALGLRCPLLVEERCSLHAERPLSCRAFNVTTPAGWCAAPTSHPVRTIPTPPLLSASLARLAAKLCGGAPALLPLGLAMGWVDAHAELGRRRWPGPELFRAWLAELGAAGDALPT